MKPTHLLAVLAIVAVTGSRAQGPTEAFKPLPITEQRNAAVGFALTQMQFFSSLLTACARLDESALVRSKSVWSEWLGRNSPYLDGANGWVLYNKAIATGLSGPQAGAALQAQIERDISANANATLHDILPGGEPSAFACEKWWKLITDPRLDVRAHPEFGGELEAIRGFHEAVKRRARR